MSKQPRRIGRPTKPVSPGKRASLGLKVTAEIKQRLDEAAVANGRTQSQEAEARLEQSFGAENLLPQTLDLKFEGVTAGLLLLLGLVVKSVTFHAARVTPRPFERQEDWVRDPRIFAEVEAATKRVLEELRPPGDAGPACDIGRRMAEIAIRLIRAPELPDQHEPLLEHVRRRLRGTINQRTGDGHGG